MTADRSLRNLSVAEVVQAAGPSARLIGGLRPLTPLRTLVGPAWTCACAPDDNLALHHALRSAPPGAVVVGATQGSGRCGHFGELMAIDALAAGLAGLVLDGPVRDVAGLTDAGLPVFHRGVGPASCAKERWISIGEPVVVGGVEVAPGDVVVGDDDGVVVVAGSEWEGVLDGIAALREHESRILSELANGRRLADVLDLPVSEPSG